MAGNVLNWAWALITPLNCHTSNWKMKLMWVYCFYFLFFTEDAGLLLSISATAFYKNM